MKRLALSICGGLLLAASMPWVSLWPLAWIGPALLLAATREAGWRRSFRLGWTGGLFFYVPVLYWLVPTIGNYTRIDPWMASAAVFLLCMVEACFVGFFCAGVEALAAAACPRLLAAPVLWPLIEWTREFFPAAFPWAPLASSQVAAPLPMVQIVDLTGAYGLSAAIVLAAAALAEAAANRRRAPVLVLGAMAVPLVLMLYGWPRIAAVERRPVAGSLRVGIVQANVAQDEKWDPALQNEILERYLRLSREDAEEGAQLIVWPEAAVPFFLEHDPRRARLVDLAVATDATLLVGSPGFRRESAGARQYNQAWLISPERGLVGVYDKMQLVPFGEYVPFGRLLGWVQQAVEAVADFGRGTHPVVFAGPAVERHATKEPVGLAPLICYEGIFPGLTRRFVAGGADLLINISNDAWYGRTSAPYQHLAMASLRAVENRIPLVRATNTGISAVVDATGKIHHQTPLFEEARLVASVDLRDGRSPYTRWGDWFVGLCGLLVASLAARALATVSGLLNRP